MEPIFVVTPGRMGSRTILSSLQTAGLEGYLVHTFGPELDHSAAKHGQDVLERSKLERALDLERAIRKAQLSGGKVNFVWTIRDPIESAISGLFQPYQLGELDRRCDSEGIDSVVAELGAQFAMLLPKRLTLMSRWYQLSLPYATGSSLPPRGSADYVVYDAQWARCLFIPNERFCRLGDALSEFAGRKVEVVTTGISASANVVANAIKARLSRAIPLSALGLHHVYSQPIMRAAYPVEELIALKSRWGLASPLQQIVGDARYLVRLMREARPTARRIRL